MTDQVATEMLYLVEHMNSHEGWGREQGRQVYGKLLAFVESKPGAMIFRVSINGVKRIDISFASETIAELARRYRGSKGFAFIDLADADMTENWDAAAQKKKQPLMVWDKDVPRVIGPQPTQGTMDAFTFALERPYTRAAEFALAAKVAIGGASMKFKQLWEQGFLLRRESVAESGGVEYLYFRIA